jgi:hypothetical protein
VTLLCPGPVFSNFLTECFTDKHGEVSDRHASVCSKVVYDNYKVITLIWNHFKIILPAVLFQNVKVKIRIIIYGYETLFLTEGSTCMECI